MLAPTLSLAKTLWLQREAKESNQHKRQYRWFRYCLRDAERDLGTSLRGYHFHRKVVVTQGLGVRSALEKNPPSMIAYP